MSNFIMAIFSKHEFNLAQYLLIKLNVHTTSNVLNIQVKTVIQLTYPKLYRLSSFLNELNPIFLHLRFYVIATKCVLILLSLRIIQCFSYIRSFNPTQIKCCQTQQCFRFASTQSIVNYCLASSRENCLTYITNRERIQQIVSKIGCTIENTNKNSRYINI